MRRTVARIGVVAALALSMGMAAVNAPSARAEEPGLVSATRADTDEMNYAINLAGTNPEDLQRALALVPGAGGAALASYPEIGTFFAQSATPSFAPDLAAALRQAGISIHSIGPTRVAPRPLLRARRAAHGQEERGSCPAVRRGWRPELHAR